MHRRDIYIFFVRILIPVMGVLLILDVCLRIEEEDLSLLPPPARTNAIIQKATQIRDDLNRALDLLEECFGHPVDLESIRSVPVNVTAYSSTLDQCDDTPFLTASQQSVHVGIIAVSDDLIEEMGLRFGQRVLIPGHGLFEVQDRMNPRWRRRVDIWQENGEVARRFGEQRATLLWVHEPSTAGSEVIAKNSGS